KTYNTRYSLVVTDPTTNPALTGLSMGERTGSRVLQWVWSYVMILHCNVDYTVMSYDCGTVQVLPLLTSSRWSKGGILLFHASLKYQHPTGLQFILQAYALALQHITLHNLFFP
ncbi:uncharacterized protein LY79DRAFT_522518, partial [Colletotrichum navitas]